MERGHHLDILHVEGDPKLIRDERHVSEENAQDAEVEIAILPDTRVEEWVCVDVLPNGKTEEEDQAENEHHDDFRGFPAALWSFPLT